MANEFEFVEYIPKEAGGIGVACILFKPVAGIYLTERVKDKQFGCPGGKVDPSDFNLEDALKRELLEETGLVMDEDRLYWYGYQKVTTEATDYTSWYLYVLRGDEDPKVMEPTKHGEWKAYKFSEALALPLFCGTKPTLERILKATQGS